MSKKVSKKIKTKNKTTTTVKTKKPFYKLWWFWLIIAIVFGGTWSLFFISEIHTRSSIIGILSIWGSTLATIFIGVITAKQADNFNFITRKKELLSTVSESIKDFQHEFFIAFDITPITSLPKVQWDLLQISDKNQRADYINTAMVKKTTIIFKLLQFENILTSSILNAQNVTLLFKEVSALANFIKNDIVNPKTEIDPKFRDSDLKQFKKNSTFIDKSFTSITQLKDKIFADGQQTKLKIISAKNLKELEFIEKYIEENQKTISDILNFENLETKRAS